MPSLKDVKTKIAGVRKTKQITKAMNMVASAKLRGAQARIERFRPYAEKYTTVLADLAGKADGAAHPLLVRHANCTVAVIILCTSDRGLCGGFNGSLVARGLDEARKKRAEGKTVRFICVGKKGRDAIRKSGFELLEAYTDVQDLDFSLASGIGKNVISGYTQLEMDEVVLVYAEMVSLARQSPRSVQVLPMQRHEVKPLPGGTPDEGRGEASAEYLYEPDAKHLLADLLPRYVNVQIYRALLETSASEHAARMAAMDNATRNCDEIASALTLLYNKTRQASITSDLIDIVGGAEALN